MEKNNVHDNKHSYRIINTIKEYDYLTLTTNNKIAWSVVKR